MTSEKGRDGEFLILRKFLRLLSRKQRISAGILAVMMLLGAALESLGIGIVMPFISVVANPAAMSTDPIASRLYLASGSSSPQVFLGWFGAAFLLIYLGKNLYLALLSYVQYRFLYRRQTEISARLLQMYLDMPYARHLEINSAVLLRNVNQEVNLAFANVVIPLALLLIEAMMVAAIILLLLLAEPIPTLLAFGVLGSAAVAFYASVRRKLSQTGQKAQEASASMIQRVNEAVGGVKESTILGRRNYFVTHFSRASRTYAEAMRTYRFIAELPRLFIETLAVAGMLAVGFMALSNGKEATAAFPLLGLFGLAAIRLMPAMNRIVSATATIRHHARSFDVIYDGLSGITESSTSTAEVRFPVPLTFEESIVFDNVGFKYRGAATPALHGISIEIARGQSIGIVGPSGSGKTTLVDVLLGLLEPTSGTIRVDGQPLMSVLSAWRASIGYVPQPSYLTDGSVRSNVAFGVAKAEIDDERIWSSLRTARCEDFVRRLPEGVDTVIGENGVRLSGGQRQRIGIARALYSGPSILVFDEATSSMDNRTESEIGSAIRDLARSKTVVVIAHRLSTVENCDSLILMTAGAVIAKGTFRHLLATSDEFRNLVQSGSLISDPMQDS